MLGGITKTMREKTIEQKLVKAVRAKGGIAPKFVSPGFSGVPGPPYPIAGWEMRLRGSKGPPGGKTTAAAGVKDTPFAAAGLSGIRPG